MTDVITSIPLLMASLALSNVVDVTSAKSAAKVRYFTRTDGALDYEITTDQVTYRQRSFVPINRDEFATENPSVSHVPPGRGSAGSRVDGRMERKLV